MLAIMVGPWVDWMKTAEARPVLEKAVSRRVIWFVGPQWVKIAVLCSFALYVWVFQCLFRKAFWLI